MSAEKSKDENVGPTRRDLLAAGAAGCAALGCLGHVLAYGASLVPKVVYEPPLVRRLGSPDAFCEGVTFLSAEKIFLVREESSFRALSAVCTHLGCTVNESTGHAAGFHCPCHGSEFDADGARTAGPAPRGLPWRPLSQAPDGALLVDLSREVAPKTALVVSEEGNK